MEDITLVINLQGFIFPNNEVIVREISWVHLSKDLGETISVFTPDYEVNFSIVYETTEKVRSLTFERQPDSERGSWINNGNVKDYIKQLYDLYGGKFAFKGGVIAKEVFDEWGIPTIFLEDIPSCVKVLGNSCSMYRCKYYKNQLKKNSYK